MITFTEEQKHAIKSYNEAHGTALSLKYSHAKVVFLNSKVFGPFGVPLLPVPSEEKVSKAKTDKRYYENFRPMSGQKKTRAAFSTTPYNLSPIDMDTPIVSINANALSSLVESAAMKGAAAAVKDCEVCAFANDSNRLCYRISLTSFLRNRRLS